MSRNNLRSYTFGENFYPLCLRLLIKNTEVIKPREVCEDWGIIMCMESWMPREAAEMATMTVQVHVLASVALLTVGWDCWENFPPSMEPYAHICRLGVREIGQVYEHMDSISWCTWSSGIRMALMVLHHILGHLIVALVLPGVVQRPMITWEHLLKK